MRERSQHGTSVPMLSALLVCFSPACGSIPTLEDRTALPLVVTLFDSSVDFGSFSTFAIVPTVSFITDVGDGGILSADDGTAIVEHLTANFEARGYTLTDAASHPDFGVVATALVRLKVETVVYPGYWGAAPGYAAPPSYWGVPSGGYYTGYGGYSSTAYKTGTLIVDLIDLRDVGSSRGLDASTLNDAGGTRLEMAWVAIMHDYVAVGGTLKPDATLAIDQAFAQSPYLQASP